jgi:hypothetical protein
MSLVALDRECLSVRGPGQNVELDQVKSQLRDLAQQFAELKQIKKAALSGE